ncbi:MAG: GNAT family N-acetyltransferase [Oceanospirillaceae bacterium]|nr:GNAT family N-acetyltransferase [Oceanospirillaceae bacterium]MCP5351274.1 GNAT family N-acetyltransferase [Oceanospirillaceae bacterium]
MELQGLRITTAHWDNDRALLSDIRRKVFIEEQNVDERLEWDGADAAATHFLAYSGNSAIGCARLIGNKIGRMAVLNAFRSLGVGAALLDHIKRHAHNQRITRLELSAQCHAYQFYRRAGFCAEGRPYADAGIPHVDMVYRVFAHEQEKSLYDINSDDQLHHAGGLLELNGMFDMLLSQCRQNLTISMHDPEHPLWRRELLLSRIKQLARDNRRFEVQILLDSEHVLINEHPLVQLQQRISSKIQLRITRETLSNLIVADSSAWLDFEQQEGRSCYADRSRTRQLQERFRTCWEKAALPQEARRLHL